jgi:type II secretory pathway component GspD/PulD (secretin)
VRLRNGQTIVLGGQRQTENMVSRRGVPILSSIPILGWLFSSRTITKTETQMMIFLTPHVYYGDDNQVKPSDFFGEEVKKMLGEGKENKNEKK